MKDHPVYRVAELALVAVILFLVLHHDAAEHLKPGVDALDLVSVLLGGKLAAGAVTLSKGRC